MFSEKASYSCKVIAAHFGTQFEIWLASVISVAKTDTKNATFLSASSIHGIAVRMRTELLPSSYWTYICTNQYPCPANGTF